MDIQEKPPNFNEAMTRAFNVAVSLQQAGRLAEAEKAWKALRAEAPSHPGINVNLGTVMWKLGRMDDAADACKRAITANPSLAEAFALLGAVLAVQQKNKIAIQNLERAVDLKPQLVTAWVQLGMLYRDESQLNLAILACKRAESLEPERTDVLNVLGLVYQARCEWELAESALRRAADGLSSGQLLAEIQTNLAGLFLDQKCFMKAAAHGREAIRISPLYPAAYNVLGIALKFLHDLTGAKKAFEKALELDLKMVEAQINLGTVFGLCGQWKKALRCFDRALEIEPNSATALNNRGNVFCKEGSFDKGEIDFLKAIEIDKNYAEPHFNLAFELLIQGRWLEGWPEFEWRSQTAQMRPFGRSFTVSQWDGSFIPKATLLVHAEQGLGDTLNFVRFIPRVSSRVGRVIFECQRPLVRLLKNVKGIDQIIAYSDALPNFDFHVPLLSLPGIFKTTLENVPEPLPYINEIQESCELISEAGDEIKVGIVWTGNPANPVNRFRTIGLSALKELFSVRGCLFFSLQCGESADKILDEGLEDRICDLRPLMDDFAATANLIRQLDVVISVCTSVAHLGGSIGSETWIILPKDADWRWLRGRSDTPWYPSVRLFRQEKLDDWVDVVNRVKEALEARVGLEE